MWRRVVVQVLNSNDFAVLTCFRKLTVPPMALGVAVMNMLMAMLIQMPILTLAAMVAHPERICTGLNAPIERSAQLAVVVLAVRRKERLLEQVRLLSHLCACNHHVSFARCVVSE